MKIVVCVKRVADTEARIRLTADGTGVDPEGVKFVINPYDEFAIEAALRQREAAGEGEVIVLSVGASDSAETLRSALAMGADRGVLLRSDASPEGLAVAQAIAAELAERDFDLLLFGMKAVDDDLQAVGAMVGELLQLPTATVVTEFRIEEGMVIADREIEKGVEVIQLTMPCILTITKGPYEPRYASLKGIMAAKKKPLDERPAVAGDSGTRLESLGPPPERRPGRIVGNGPEAVPELVRLLREEAKVL